MFLHVRKLALEDAMSFDGFYAIYSRAFPPSEQKSAQALRDMLKRDTYTIFLAHNDEKIIGFCIMYHPTNDDFFLLEYMATDPQIRGQGIGTTLLSQSLENLTERFGIRALIIEIDSPEKVSHEQEIRERRERFYRRLGALKIDPFDYILPSQTNEEAPPMELLVIHPHLRTLSQETLQIWLEKLYVDVYGCERKDPRIAEMLHDTPEILHLI
jgi:GNAT superfamily N-acetyltransferase